MNRGAIFWGFVLVLLGVLFLLQSTGLLRLNIWTLFWPLLLIAWGVWILIGTFGRRPQPQEVTMELKGVEEARLFFRYGAGKLTIDGRAAPDELLHGQFGTGLAYERQEEGERVTLYLRPPEGASLAPWNWGSHERDWNVHLNNAIPLELDVETGAAEAHLDLSEMQVRSFRLKTGASDSRVILPAQATYTRATIDSGMASVTLRVPDGVAAQIESEAGMAEVKVNRTRFPRAGKVYRSADYDAANHRVDLTIRVGMGSVTVE
jgi:hypothetical protein